MEKIIEHIQSPLVCPIDKAALIDNKDCWQCTKCGIKYKVVNGIPNLIPEEAENFKNNIQKTQ